MYQAQKKIDAAKPPVPKAKAKAELKRSMAMFLLLKLRLFAEFLGEWRTCSMFANSCELPEGESCTGLAKDLFDDAKYGPFWGAETDESGDKKGRCGALNWDICFSLLPVVNYPPKFEKQIQSAEVTIGKRKSKKTETSWVAKQ